MPSLYHACSTRNLYPRGLKPGDFIQTTAQVSGVFFEAVKCIPPTASSQFWLVTYIHYSKYGTQPQFDWINGASHGIRRLISAEMAIPLMLHKGLSFHASLGQFDPVIGFAPAGTALRHSMSLAVN